MVNAGGGRRIAAWLVDWLVVSVYTVALIPLGVVLAPRVTLSALQWNVATFVLLILPVTVWLAWWEHARAATPGKRMLRLSVHPELSFGRALARNGLKVALPWELGHTAAYSFAMTDAFAAGLAFFAAAVGLALWYVVSLFAGDGTTPYDRLVHTAVHS